MKEEISPSSDFDITYSLIDDKEDEKDGAPVIGPAVGRLGKRLAAHERPTAAAH